MQLTLASLEHKHFYYSVVFENMFLLYKREGGGLVFTWYFNSDTS